MKMQPKPRLLSILKQIKKNGTATSQDCADTLNISVQNAATTLLTLLKRGLVTRTKEEIIAFKKPGFIYKITRRGIAFIEALSDESNNQT